MATNSFFDRISQLSPKRLALLAMDLQAKLETAERQRAAPIAVIGMACRYPGGANTPADFWRLLSDGVDAITEIPPSRWAVDDYYDPDPDAPGKIATRWGGFVDDFDRFDPQFFGISPREALSMDPQQRLLLEVGWEALENAGYAPDKLTGSRTGVFIGVCNSDYLRLLTSAEGYNFDTYTATGSAHSVASGRLSYVLGLQGPSFSVDTACSSSLVAIHLAIQSLRQGECSMALAGGVNLLASVEITIALSRGRMMSSDGRCKAFAAGADGFVRSEGCGLVVFKHLSQAIADGDNILAVIRGTAINQDGRSNGLTAPNGPSQEAVIREALANAGVEPHEVSYVETHGTGTSLGDPIEAQALGAVLGQGRSPAKPLAIGSVKTNVGHLEAAAGVAGFTKLVLALQHREIPPHLHLRELNPYIPWDELPLVVPTQGVPWSPENGRYIGGVSSFGFSGTNVHVVVEAAPDREPTRLEIERPLHLFSLSAKSEAALKVLAGRYEQHLAADPAESLADVSFTANVGRAHFTHRLAVIAEEAGQVREALAAWTSGQQPDNMISGQMHGTRSPEVAFLFTGQGAQYMGMGRALYQTQPTFRGALDRCDELLRPYLGCSLLDVIYPEPGQPPLLDEIAYAQPALFAMEYALAELWRSWGIEPAVVVGHSIGEYAAACVAGVFSLEDGLKLTAERGRLMQEVSASQQGEMAAVFADEARVAAAIAPYADRVSIAAVNGPETVVISGEKVAVEAVLNDLKASRIRGRHLPIPVAGHSPLMAPILDAFERTAAEIAYAVPHTDIVSGLTGQLITGQDIANAGYWRRHLREGVQFYPAMRALHEQGYKIFIEIGPSPTLIEMGQHCLPPGAGVWLPSLRPKHDDWRQMLKSLATLYVHGVTVDWAGFERDYAGGRHRVPLPTYPFENERYWFTQAQPSRQKPGPAQIVTGHPLLGQRLRSPVIEDAVFESHLGANWPPFLSHHKVYGLGILPSPAFIEMALTAALETMGPGPHALSNFNIYEALVLPEEGLRATQLILKPEENGQAAFRVVSLEDGEDWRLHVTGTLQRMAPEAVSAADEAHLAVDAIQARCPEEVSGEVYYGKLRDLGLEFGTDFRGITKLWRRDGEALGLVQLPEALAAEADTYHIHPAFLDACFHLLGAPLAEDLETAYLLIGIESFRLYRPPGAQLWNHTMLQERDKDHKEIFTGQIRLYDQAGQLVAEVEGLHLKRAGREALLQSTRRRPNDWLYQVQWQPKPHPNPALMYQPPEYMPAPEYIAAQVTPQVSPLAAQHELASYRKLLPGLDALSAACVAQALRELGWEFPLGETISTDSLAARLKVERRHLRLLGRLLEILGEEGVLRRTGSTWEVARQPAEIDPQTQLSALLAQFPAFEAELALTGRCGPYLAKVLQGAYDPLHLLFPDGSLTDLEKLYQESPSARVYNALVRQAMAAALAQLPKGRTVRILEIGAGTGATTSYVLPELPAGQTDYVFTDLSPLFTAAAAEKFKNYSFIRYQLLDIELDPGTQGLANQQFDIILAANVLHATSDLRQTLGHVKQLLAPQGLLILLEGTGRQRWVDLTFGLTEGWWKFADADLRPAYPLLSPQQWLDLLQTMGFVAPASIPTLKADDDVREQVIILAQGPQPEQPVTPQTPQGSWLIFADSGGVGQELVELLKRRGDHCLLVSPAAAYAAVEGHWQVDPARPKDFQRLVSEALESDGLPCRGIVHLWGLRAQPPEETTVSSLEADQSLICGSALHLAQALLSAKEKGIEAPPLWFVTSGAQPAGAEPERLKVGQTPLWGLGRVIALEHPELWGGLVDLDPHSGAVESAHHLLAEISQSDGEDQVAWREGQRYIARLVRGEQPSKRPVRWQADGAYLITGGLGGLGLKIAHWMAEQGARYLVLTGRRGLPDRDKWATVAPDSDASHQVAAIQAIEALGAKVVVEAADVSDMTRMAALLQQFGQTAPPLRGIIHAAAALSSWTLKEMPLTALMDMLKPKVMGTWALHQLTQEMDLDFFGLFSSTTALWGSKGLAHYAAANHFLDGFAHYRHSLELPALSINWGTWDQMRLASAEAQQMAAQTGLNRMPSEQALGFLGDFLGSAGVSQVTVAAVDWSVLKPAYEARRQRPFLQYVEARQVEARRSSAKAEQSPPERPALLRQLAEARPENRQDLLVKHVQREVAKVLEIDPAQPIELDRGLFEMGMDSLMAVELRGRLEAGVGQTLPTTLIFNYPTIADLAQYLGTQVLDIAQAGPAVVESPSGVEQPPGRSEQPSVAESGVSSAAAGDLSEDELAALLLKKLEQIQ